MSRVVALAGTDAPASPPAPTMMLAWGVVIGTTLGIFIGTLMLSPARKRRA